VLAFYTRELVAAGLEIPAGSYSETEDGGLIQARSPDGCRSVLVTVGEEADVSQITYQFHDCAQAPEGVASAAGPWTRPLPEGPPRSEGGVRVELLATFTTQEGFIRALGFSSDGSRLASASADGTILVWDLASEEEVTRIEEPAPPNRALATALALDAEDRLLAYASRGRLFVRDLASGSPVEAPSPGATEIADLSFDGDGDLLALATLDPGGVQLLERGSGWRPRWQSAIEGEPEEVRIGASGERLAVAVPCRGFELMDTRTGRRVDAVGGWPLDFRLCGEYFAAAFSPDLAVAANATDGPEIYRWDLVRGRSLGKMTNPRGGDNLSGVTALAFAPAGWLLAAGTVDGRVELWDWASQTLSGELFEVTGSDVARITFSADGRRMAVGDWYGVVRVLEIDSVSESP
jgi:WD40 repeat protein